MIQIYLSAALAKPLSRHLQPARNLDPVLQWRADIAFIANEPCIVAHELFSNYIMVFCALSKEDFVTFPDLFRDRLWREAMAICSQSDLLDREQLGKALMTLCTLQSYSLDPEEPEIGRISKTIEKLERRFLYDKLPLPADGRSAFEFTLAINSQKAVKGERAGQPTAMETLGNLLLGQVARNLTSAEPAESPVIGIEDNIVKVDFSAQRKSR